jgi:hypothetical protein
MSVNSSVQHLASGLGTTIGGMIVEGGAGEPLRHFGTVGILAAALTLMSLWIAPRIRPVNQHGNHAGILDQPATASASCSGASRSTRS